MPNIRGRKLMTGPRNRVNCHWTITEATRHAVDNEAARLQTSKNWLVNEVLRRALVMREIEFTAADVAR